LLERLGSVQRGGDLKKRRADSLPEDSQVMISQSKVS